MKKFLFWFLGIALCSTELSAIPIRLSDQAVVSLLTCSPGTAIYELFGHTGIRVRDSLQRIDIVYNYGLFDSEQDRFVYRFVRGKTDYEAGRSSYGNFILEYRLRGSAITENVLNLSLLQKQTLVDILEKTCRPENRVYRYNFIYNNCATQVRDVIENCIDCPRDCKLLYPYTEPMSFRNAIRLYTQTSPWSQLGFDLCLGGNADYTATTRELLFLPEILQSTYAEAQIQDKEGNREALCLSENILFPCSLVNEPPLIGPDLAAWALFLALTALSLWAYYRNKDLFWLDVILFTINGLMSMLLVFLILFSQHPFTTANFNIGWCNPLFFGQLLLCIPALRKFRWWYSLVMVCMLTAFLFSTPLLTQEFNTAIYPIVFLYFMRCCCTILMPFKHRKTRKN